MSIGSYTFLTIDVPGSSWGLAYDLNNNNLAVGTYGDSSGSHGFLYDISTGSFTSYDAPGALYLTAVTGVNDAGQFVGSKQVAGGNVGLDGGPVVRDINNNGLALPLVNPPGISYPGASLTLAEGLNDVGTVVGGANLNGTQYGFSLSNDIYTPLMFPGSQFTVAFGVNNSGLTVGNFVMCPTCPHEGFLFDGVDYYQLSYPGALQTEIFGVNDQGDLAGAWWGADHVSHPFLGFDPPVLTADLTSVPEPASIVIFAVALLSLALVRMRGRDSRHRR